MSDFEALSNAELGLLAMAACADKRWFHAHTGAGLLAIDALGAIDAEREYRDRAETLIKDFGDTGIVDDKSPILSDWRKRLTKVIENKQGLLRNSGHGTIFLMWAMRALDQLPKRATENMVSALEQVISNAFSDDQDRYFGIPEHDLETVKNPQTKQSDEELVVTAISSAVPRYKDVPGTPRTWFFTGSKIHIATYLHALFWLRDQGENDIYRLGEGAWYRLVALCQRMEDHALKKDFETWNYDTLDHRPNDFFYEDPHGYKLVLAFNELTDMLGESVKQQLEIPMENSLRAIS
jgi:hypothetical protein